MKVFIATFIVSGFLAVAFFMLGPGVDLTEMPQVAEIKSNLKNLLSNESEPKEVEAADLIQPALTIGLATGDEQADDIEGLIETMDLGFLRFPITSVVEGVLEHTDSTRRAGAIAYFNYGATKPSLLAFVPVTDMDGFVETLGDFAEVKEGTPQRVIFPQGFQLYFVHCNDYAYFSNERESLTRLEQIDPNDWLGDIPATSNLAISLDSTRIPQQVKNESLSDLKKYIWQAASKSENFDDPKKRHNLDQALTAQMTLLKEIDQFQAGLDVDPISGKILVDWEIIGSPLSTFVKYGQQAKRMHPSRFTRFRQKDATVNMNFRSPILPEHTFELEILAELLEVVAGLPDENLDKLCQESGRAIKRTLKKGIIDGALVGKVEENRLNFAAIIHIEDTRRIAHILDLLNRPSGSAISGQKIIVNNMAGNYKGINFYQRMETMDKGPLARQRMAFVFGAGQDEILLGVGYDPMVLIRDCIDACAGELPSNPPDFCCQIKLSDIGKFGAKTELEKQILRRLSESDRLNMETEFTKTGSRSKVELDINFIKSCWEVGHSMINEVQ